MKTRLQVSGDGAHRNYKSLGVTGTIQVIVKEEGFATLWKGIGAAWLREASYTSLRLGLYGPIKDVLGIKKNSNFFWKFAAGSLAGAIGSCAGNPFDVLKTRMMASEGKGDFSLRQAASHLYETEGLHGFYRGFQANIMRAMVLNGTKMSCYDQIKTMITHAELIPAGLPTQFVSAFSAGFFMATTVTPFDMIRTQLMNQDEGHKLYNGFIDCTTKILRTRGIAGLYAGFIPIWARFAPTTTIQLVVFEQIKPIFGVKGGSSE